MYDPAASVMKIKEIMKTKEPDLDAAELKLLDSSNVGPKAAFGG
jgi:hypothetical protein